MFKKLQEKWKHEWWNRKAGDIALEYQARRIDLEKRLEEEMARTKEMWDIELEVTKTRIDISKKKIYLEEEEVSHRLKVLEDRKLELIKADNELKAQIKLLEAKASPSSVWAEAFSQGVNKTWDLLLPVMSENIERLKSKIKDDAIKEAIGRLHVTNKK